MSEKRKSRRSLREVRTAYRSGPLSIRPELKDPTKRYVWDLNRPNNIHYRLDLGYRACTDDAIREDVGDKTLNEDSNTRGKYIIRTGKDGQELILMEIDKEIFEEIKAEQAELAQEQEDQTKSDAAENPNFYGHQMKMTSQTHDIKEE